LISGYWSFSPIRANPVREDHPRRPVSRAGRLRKEQEDILLEAGAAVAFLPDFYGPGADMSFVHGAIEPLLRSRRGTWPGAYEAPREFLYIPDAGRILCDLAAQEEAYGKGWVVAAAGPITPRRAVEAAAAYAGVRARVREIGPGVMRAAGLFNRDIRLFADIAPVYRNPVFFDATRLRGLLGSYHVTSYEIGLAATVDWLRPRRG
ncbi:MAG: epimerase, partial [Planctomycetota bacterium]